MTQEQETEQERTESDCMHHWLIESPNGPVSVGVCKICGEKGEFKNSIQGSGWDRENPQSKRARQARNEQQQKQQQEQRRQQQEQRRQQEQQQQEQKR